MLKKIPLTIAAVIALCFAPSINPIIDDKTKKGEPNGEFNAVNIAAITSTIIIV